jgi:hypothetical protein
MAILGCTNAKAVNYNSAADTDDGSCIYLRKVDGTCYAFKDVDNTEIVDESFTLSYGLDGQDWVFFHSYKPDFYFSSREQLYNLKDKKVYIHNRDLPGLFYKRISGNRVPDSFFVDAVFSDKEEMILNSINWLSEVINQQQELEFSTLTHITIWNNQQCTGKIALTQVFQDLKYDVRKTQALWSFDSFRDLVKVYGTKFLLDIFHNFAVDNSTIDTSKPWFDQDLLHDNFFVIRLEFDNTSGKQMILHGADVDVSKSYR